MQSDQINELATALAAAQGEMPSAEINQINTFLKNKYADLGSVIKASREVLAKNNLAVSQLVIGGEGHVGVETILMHKSGQWLSSVVTLPTGEKAGQSQAQVAGSIVSYLRRYSLSAMLGIYADEDTDGNKPASTPAPQPEKKEQPANPLAPPPLEFLYRDGAKVDPSKPREVESFKNYLETHNGTAPASREALRAAVLAAGSQTAS